MAIGIGVAMAWKMFSYSHYSLTLKTFCIHYSESRHFFAVGSERPCADDGIFGITIYVNNWSKIDVDPELAALASNLFSKPIDNAV